MAANVYRGSCLGDEALAELASLGIQPSETKCTPIGVNSCEGPLDQLLGSYFVFALPADQPRSFTQSQKVLFVEDQGFKLVLKQANQNISSNVVALDQANWTEICSLRPEVRYEPISAEAMRTTFNQIQPDQAYSLGDVYYRLSECEDIVCLYMINQPVPVGGSVEGKSSLLYCSATGLNKCTEYQRKKTPEDLYAVVEIGSECDYIEAPLRYELRRPLLNDLAG